MWEKEESWQHIVLIMFVFPLQRYPCVCQSVPQNEISAAYVCDTPQATLIKFGVWEREEGKSELRLSVHGIRNLPCHRISNNRIFLVSTGPRIDQVS